MEKSKSRSSFSVQGILNNLSSNIKNGSDDGSFRIAALNGVALIIVFIVFVIASSCYYILHPFIKPLLWALICGSVLHPLKLALALKFSQIMITVESSETTPCQIVFLPISSFMKLADYVGAKFASYWKVWIYAAFVSAFVLIIYFYFPSLPSFFSRSLLFSFCVLDGVTGLILNVFSSFLVVGTCIVTFAGSLIFFWNPQIKNFYCAGTLCVWIALSAYFCSYLSYFQNHAFILLQTSTFGSYYLYAFYNYDKQGDTEGDKVCGDQEDSLVTTPKLSIDGSSKTSGGESMMYIRYLTLIVLMFHFMQFLFIVPVLVAVYLVKITLTEFGIVDVINSQLNIANDHVRIWFEERRTVLLPAPLEYNIEMLNYGWKSMIRVLRKCSDSFAAVAVILLLLLFVFFATFFLALQAYREGVYLVQTGGSIINSTIVHNPELHHLLPEDWEFTLDTALNNTYMYIRKTLANMLRGFLKDKGISESRSVELERNVQELWDRAYQAWVVPLQPNKLSADTGPSVTPEAVRHSFLRFIDGLKGTPEVANLASLGQFVSDNMATVASSLDSLWIILKGNMSLLLSLLSTLFSIVFGGSMSLINFIFNVVVFLTALFYLLSTSRDMYKPVEMITGMSPVYGNKLAVAVDKACQGVLVASAKLSLFYGLWTWLIHTLFQCNFVYMPALFAAVLGVVPVLGSYWSCLPAVLDLWLVQDMKLMALGLFLSQIFPTLIVDSTIYNEMKGGHPYLTGLSVAGGIFWLGLEGAIIGPLILCFLFVIVNITTDLVNQSDEHLASSKVPMST